MERLVPATVASRAENARRIPLAFGRRFFLLLLIGLVWIVPAWYQPRFLFVLVAWDLLTVALWAWDLRGLPAPGQLEIRRIWREALGLAHKCDVAIEVRNDSGRPITAQIGDDAPDTFSAAMPTESLAIPAAGSATMYYAVSPRQRGDAAFGNVWLRYSSPLQLAERWARARLAQSVRVYPNLAESRKMQIYLIRSRQIDLEKRLKRQRGHGREFESLREYRPGDEFRDISWSATARRGKLITKLHQIERSQTVWLVLDAGRLLRARVGEITKLDCAVAAALSLAQVALYSGDRVALLAYGRKPQQRLGPGRDIPHLRRLIESLAQVHAEPMEADHLGAAQALIAAHSQRSLVVWLTDLAETAATPEVIECASPLTHRHLVLFAIMAQTELRKVIAAPPASVHEMYLYSAALEIVQRRELLVRRLRQGGAMVVEAPPAGLSAALANQYLQVKERNLL